MGALHLSPGSAAVSVALTEIFAQLSTFLLPLEAFPTLSRSIEVLMDYTRQTRPPTPDPRAAGGRLLARGAELYFGKFAFRNPAEVPSFLLTRSTDMKRRTHISAPSYPSSALKQLMSLRNRNPSWRRIAFRRDCLSLGSSSLSAHSAAVDCCRHPSASLGSSNLSVSAPGSEEIASRRGKLRSFQSC